MRVGLDVDRQRRVRLGAGREVAGGDAAARRAVQLVAHGGDRQVRLVGRPRRGLRRSNRAAAASGAGRRSAPRDERPPPERRARCRPRGSAEGRRRAHPHWPDRRSAAVRRPRRRPPNGRGSAAWRRRSRTRVRAPRERVARPFLVSTSSSGASFSAVDQRVDDARVVPRDEPERVARLVGQARAFERQFDVARLLARPAAGEHEIVDHGRGERVLLAVGGDGRRRGRAPCGGRPLRPLSRPRPGRVSRRRPCSSPRRDPRSRRRNRPGHGSVWPRAPPTGDRSACQPRNTAHRWSRRAPARKSADPGSFGALRPSRNSKKSTDPWGGSPSP